MHGARWESVGRERGSLRPHLARRRIVLKGTFHGEEEEGERRKNLENISLESESIRLDAASVELPPATYRDTRGR